MLAHLRLHPTPLPSQATSDAANKEVIEAQRDADAAESDMVALKKKVFASNDASKWEKHLHISSNVLRESDVRAAREQKESAEADLQRALRSHDVRSAADEEEAASRLVEEKERESSRLRKRHAAVADQARALAEVDLARKAAEDMVKEAARLKKDVKDDFDEAMLECHGSDVPHEGQWLSAIEARVKVLKTAAADSVKEIEAKRKAFDEANGAYRDAFKKAIQLIYLMGQYAFNLTRTCVAGGGFGCAAGVRLTHPPP